MFPQTRKTAQAEGLQDGLRRIASPWIQQGKQGWRIGNVLDSERGKRMRAAWQAIGTLLVLFFLPFSPASAQMADKPCLSKSALGVSRTVEIDTATGPRFGLNQYKDYDFLEDGEVVLTFDDGPLRHNTQAVLDALSAHCTKATFFMVGRMALSDPEMVKEVARRGHTIGTHTWSHRNLKSVLVGTARDEVELGISAVQRALGAPVAPFFRFPYLSDPKSIQAYLEERKVAAFSIDADAYDYRTHDPGTVFRTVMRQLQDRKKGIILFHDIQPSTAQALKGLLDELKNRGFRVVHIVPKTQLQSVAEYDAMAEKAFNERRLASAANPLAKRSVVWPISPGPAAVTAASGRSSAREPDETWQAKIFPR
jgi:peptidoglycan/xylan/chitin deacetylase (PgdA/CDA1 family)